MKKWTPRSGLSSGAADIFANTGGVMEAALRTVYEIVTGRPLPMANLHVAPVAGLAEREGSVTDHSRTRCPIGPSWTASR